MGSGGRRKEYVEMKMGRVSMKEKRKLLHLSKVQREIERTKMNLESVCRPTGKRYSTFNATLRCTFEQARPTTCRAP
jgi:hypothetical protein